MPRISSFYGITIWMYYDEIQHRGRPHFHAQYGEAEASIDIALLVAIAGKLPPRAARLVTDWARMHQLSYGQTGSERAIASRLRRSISSHERSTIGPCAALHF